MNLNTISTRLVKSDAITVCTCTRYGNTGWTTPSAINVSHVSTPDESLLSIVSAAAMRSRYVAFDASLGLTDLPMALPGI